MCPWGFPNLVSLGLLSVLRLCFSVSFSLFLDQTAHQSGGSPPIGKQIRIPQRQNLESVRTPVSVVCWTPITRQVNLVRAPPQLGILDRRHLAQDTGQAGSRVSKRGWKKKPCLAPSQRTHNRIFKTRLKKIKHILSTS